MAFQISLASNTSKIVREYQEGILLEDPYEVGLKHFVSWNNVYNITKKNNCFVLIEDRGGLEQGFHEIFIPEGLYEVDDLFAELNKNPKMTASSTKLSLDKNKLKIKISTKWSIDFTGNKSMGNVLGFSKRITPKGRTVYSDFPINIFNINTVKINCNLVHTNIQDYKRNVNTLYDFPFDSSKIGGPLIKEPNPICYFPVTVDRIYELVITITDQDNNLIDFRGESINLTLDFRPLHGY